MIHAGAPYTAKRGRDGPSPTQLAERLKPVLWRIVGRANRATTGEIMRFLDLQDDRRSNQPLRAALKLLLVEKLIPIVSDSGGFWVATTRDEIDGYRRSLQARVAGLQRDIAACQAPGLRWDVVSLLKAKHERLAAPKPPERQLPSGADIFGNQDEAGARG